MGKATQGSVINGMRVKGVMSVKGVYSQTIEQTWGTDTVTKKTK